MTGAGTEATRTQSREQRRRALQRQVARLERRLANLEQTSARLTWARLLVFLAGIIFSGILFFLRGPLPWLASLAIWLIPFALTVAYHRRIDGAIRRHRLWRDLKERHLARMALDWAQLPAAAVEVWERNDDHPFAGDLDLLGPRSLHRLIDIAVSSDGSRRLRAWLLDIDPQMEEIARRQALVRALRPLSLFRDRLALQAMLAADDEHEQWHAETLLNWAKAENDPSALRRWVLGLTTLGLINAVFLVLTLRLAWPPYWIAGVLLYFAIYLGQGRVTSHFFQEAMSLQDALAQMTTVFSFLERPRYQTVQALQDVCAPFRGENRPPSQHLRALGRVVAAAGLSRNPVLWLALNLFFPWDLTFAYRLHRLREDIAERLPVWLDAWFQLEAASSLANLAYLNPHYTFPEVSGSIGSAVPFVAREMGHPLIRHEEKVCNGFTVSSLGDVFIVTGSNMAGKSSFLRTVGVNLCLAYAGGPVDADFLQTGLFRLFTAIRVTDSVTDGISYFYAEVKRLKALLQALKQDEARPLFFLIDEIFRGTNNRERLLGSRAYIRALVGENGVGIIATHDLELVQLAQEMPQVSNYHFRDAVQDGRMVFDYRLRPGPSPTTNALKVMASEGLPVPEGDD